jgi:hypothetical protein
MTEGKRVVLWILVTAVSAFIAFLAGRRCERDSADISKE